MALVGFWQYLVFFGTQKELFQKTPFNENDIDDFLFYGVLGAIIGGRLGYMFFYGTDQIFNDPISIFRVWEGGLSFHGGFIGVLVSFFIFSKKLNIDFFDLADHIALAFPIGLGMVRIGNFLGGELLGRPTDLPWGMIFGVILFKLAGTPHNFIKHFLKD